MNLSSNSIRSRTKRTWSNSRYLENHYDSKLHSTPFLPCGLNDSKQIVYSDIGLSEIRTNCTKLKNFQDLEQRNISVKEIIHKQGNWRPFVEFQEKIEMVVTIEYCTNCKEHQRSTRHNEEQYAHYAQTIKQQILLNYPEIKVYLKPLVFESDNSINSLFLQRRIGAFEIQFQVNGQQSTLFSKLQSKSWPNSQDILKAIHSKFKKTNLLIQISFEDNDTNVKQITVILQSHTQLRPQSRLSENRSTKSTLSRQRAVSQQSSVMRYVEKSDSQGRVLFQNLPIDRYNLTIKESCNNLPIDEIISLHELNQSDGAYYHIKLQKPKIAVLRVEVIGPQNIPQTDTQVYVLTDSEKMLLKEVTDNSGIYEGYLEPGHYNLVAYKYGFEQTSERIDIKGGFNLKKLQISNKSNEISVLFNQNTNQTILNSSTISKKKRTIKIQQKVLALLEVGQMFVYDYFTSEPIAQAKIIISDSHYKRLITCTSNQQGVAKLYYSNLNQGTLKVEHKDYYVYETTYSIDVKINQFRIIKRTETLSILTDQQCSIMSDGNELAKQTNQDMCYFTNLNALLYIIIYNDISYSIKILASDQINELKQPKIDNTKFPQFWLLGIFNDNEYQVLNQIINHQEFRNLYSDIKFHQHKIIKVFTQDYYLNEFNQLSSINKQVDQIIDVLFGDDETPIIITSNTINGQPILLSDISCNITINSQIIQQTPPTLPVIITKAQLLNKDIYLYMNNYVLIFSQSFQFKGYAKLDCYYCQEISGMLITIGSQINLYQLQIAPKSVQFFLKKSSPSYCTITTSLNLRENIILGRSDGVLSLYSHSLEPIDHIKISLNSILQIHNSNYLYVSDRYNVFLLDEQFKLINKIKIPGTILFIYDQLRIITNQATLQYNDPTKLRNYPLEQARLIFSGSIQNYAPKCFYKNRQETIANINDDQWIVELLNENVRVGLEIKGSVQGLKIYLQTQYCKQELGTFKIKRTKGLWILGFFMYKDDEHIIHEIENKFIEKGEFTYLLNINGENIGLNDNSLIISNQNGFESLDYLNNGIIQQYECEQVSCIRQFDNNLIIGQKNGCIQIYKKESQYLNKQEIRICDKNIIDILLLDNNQYIISTEDKKIILFINKIEQQESLDKSIVNNLILFNKNQFISSQIDGRVRVWKKERNGQTFQITQCRTIQVMKQISQIMQIPWETQNVLICGELLQLYNMDNGKLIRSYQGQKINCIQCIWNNIILSGNMNGQIVKMNYGTGELVETIQLDSMIQKIMRSNEYMMILNEQGIHIF